jgi:hypothetical protein
VTHYKNGQTKNIKEKGEICCDTLQNFGEPRYKIVDLCSGALKQGKLILLTFLSDYTNGIIN